MENQEEQPVIQPQIPVQPGEQPMITKNLLPKWPLIIVGIILLATLLTGAFVLSKNSHLSSKSSSTTIQKPSPTTTSNQIAGWKTYTNSKVGVEFKYPPTWTAKFDPNWALAVFLDNHPFEIIPQSEPPSTSISIAFNEQGNIGERSFRETTLAQGQQNIEKLFDQNTIRIKLLTIGGKDAVQITGQGTGMLSGYLEYTLIQMDNKLLIIELKNQNFENIYQQLLSTLKFTEPVTQTTTPTPISERNARSIPLSNGYNQLISDKFHFSINYPETFRNGCVGSDGWCGDGSLNLHFPSPDNAYYIFLANTNNAQNLSFKDLVTASLPQNFKDNFTYTTKSLNGYTIYETEDLPSRSGCLFTFVTNDSSKYVQISMCRYDSKSPSNEQNQRLNIFNQILSTFKFTQ